MPVLGSGRFSKNALNDFYKRYSPQVEDNWMVSTRKLHMRMREQKTKVTILEENAVPLSPRRIRRQYSHIQCHPVEINLTCRTNLIHDKADRQRNSGFSNFVVIGYSEDSLRMSR
jgi:hypothetical protein